MPKDQRTLLLDGDIILYHAVAGTEEELAFEGAEPAYFTDLEAAWLALRRKIRELCRAAHADYILCFSDPERRYFRHDILPTYKEHRVGTRKPKGMKELRDICEAELETAWKPRLEGDDVMGILATTDELPGKKCIVSSDKDMLSIPGPVIRGVSATAEMVVVTEEEADRFHMLQTLTGDAVDNYSGCPGIGPTRAAIVVDCKSGQESYEHVFKSGPRKGQSETRWRAFEASSVWEAIVSHYERHGLTEDDALVQAQVARILRAEDWDTKKQEPILWTPSRN